MKEEFIREKVHELYWQYDTNCARTALICLSELFRLELSEQTYAAAIGMHGAGKFGAQCGLVEGPLMFIGIFGYQKGMGEDEISDLCFRFAQGFTEKFGSLRCMELRPGGFTQDAPPHLCEQMTVEAVQFARHFIETI